MKQMKFFLVALMTLAMGMSVTSCMKGDDNPIRDLSVIARLDSYSSTFKMMDGTKLVSTDPTAIMILNSGMYIVNGQYNSDEVSANSPISLTLAGTPTKIDGPSVTNMEQTPNAASFALDYQGVYPYLFDKNTLIIPAIIWVKGSTNTEASEDAAKHSIVITYDEIKKGDTELVLHLNDIITENTDAERKVLTIKHQAYDLTSVIGEFTSKGNTLKKIVIKAKVNATSNKLDDATNTKDETFDKIDYTKIQS